MLRTKRLVLLLALLALVAAGCATSGAAQVNDASIEAESVYPLAGLDAADLNVSGDDFRGALTLLIIQNALAQAAAEEFGLADPATNEARTAYLATVSDQERAAIEGAVNAGVEQGRDRDAAANYIVTQQIIGTSVREAIAHDEAFLRPIYEETPELLIVMCVSHILVETKEEADDVLARLAAGEEFAVLAAELSLDQQSPGGALPCPSTPYALGDAFGDAVVELEVGLAPEPIETGFGFHVIDVHSKESPASFEELAADPMKYVPSQLIEAEYGEWLDLAVARATISVRSNIGRWSPSADGIAPPPPSP